MIQFRNDIETMSRDELVGYIDSLEDVIQHMAPRTGDDNVLRAAAAFKLTKSEAKMLLALRARDVAGKEYLRAAVSETGADDGPDIKIIDVHACRLRKKLKGTGIGIDTIWAHGYKLTGKDRLDAVLAGAAPETGLPEARKPKRSGRGKRGKMERTFARDKVLVALRQMADELGFVTTTARQLSSIVDVGRTPVSTILWSLAARGDIQVLRHATVGAGPSEWEIRVLTS